MGVGAGAGAGAGVGAGGGATETEKVTRPLAEVEMFETLTAVAAAPAGEAEWGD